MKLTTRQPFGSVLVTGWPPAPGCADGGAGCLLQDASCPSYPGVIIKVSAAPLFTFPACVSV